ncbi:MAG: hypothetical protein ACRDZO_04875 [Egibacteraceae bacterium]
MTAIAPLEHPAAPTIVDGTRREFLAGASLSLLLLTGFGEDGGDQQAQTRTIRHELGESKAPIRAERIVTTDYDTTATMLALGRPACRRERPHLAVGLPARPDRG